MKRLLGLILTGSLLLTCATICRAEDGAAEGLLPRSTQVYLHWDGAAAHKAALEQAALGKLMRGDVQLLMAELRKQLPDQLRASLTGDKLLSGMSPDQLVKIDADINQVDGLPELLLQHGLIAGFEVRSPLQFGPLMQQLPKLVTGEGVDAASLVVPQFQLTLIVPDAAKDVAPILAALRLLGYSNNLASKELQLDGRVVTELTGPSGPTKLYLLGWVEGRHVVLTMGNQPTADVIKQVSKPGPRLLEHPLYQQCRKHHQFHNDVRGFVDVASIWSSVRGLLTMADAKIMKRLDAVGLGGVKSVVYSSGYDGEDSRSVLEVEWSGPRTGIGRVLGGKQLPPGDFPPMPTDVTRVAMHRVDMAALYEVGLQLLEVFNILGDANAAPVVKGEPREKPEQHLDRVLGINVREEVLPYLGDRVVLFNTPGEGAIFIGQVLAVEVTNAPKVLQALDQAVQEMIQNSGGVIRLRKRACLDSEVREVNLGQNRRGFPFIGAVSYAASKNWLVFALFPQPVRGFVLRSGAVLPSWKPPARVDKILASLPHDYTTFSFTDPRPSVDQLLGFTTLTLNATQNFSNTPSTFEVGTIPSAAAINAHLYPSVTVIRSEGRRLVWESRGSVLTPGESTGIDFVFLFVLAQIIN